MVDHVNSTQLRCSINPMNDIIVVSEQQLPSPSTILANRRLGGRQTTMDKWQGLTQRIRHGHVPVSIPIPVTLCFQTWGLPTHVRA